MKKRLFIVLLVLAFLGLPTVALASDISGARYYALIQVSNNGTATADVATTCNISTQNLINGNYLNSSANNCVIRTSSGAEVPFMPAVNATYPWCIWVPSIGADSYQNDILYTANSTGGQLRYFPAAGGMTRADSASLEPTDNFTIEQSGWINTDNGTDKIIINKPGAFWIYVSPTMTGNITAAISANVCATQGTLSHNNMLNWNAERLVDGDITTKGFDTDGAGAGSWVRIDYGAGNATELIGWSYYTNGTNCNANWNIQYSTNAADWTTVYTGLEMDGASGWHTATWDSPGAYRYWRSYKTDAIEAGDDHMELFTLGTEASVNVTATGVSTGEHTVRATANVTHLGIYIDGSLEDSAALTTDVIDTAANWTYYQNMEGYWHYTRIWIDGVLQQDIIWEYGTTFTDLSGNNHDATPTFRTASSDADVSAELVNFQPIAEAQAPDYALGIAPAFIDPNITGNMTGAFTITPGTGTFPLAEVIATVANATSTPPQLPLLIIAIFIILAASLTMSALMRQYGSGSLLAKIGIIVAFMGIFIAVGNFAIDFWMLVVFLILAVSIAFMSKQIGWT